MDTIIPRPTVGMLLQHRDASLSGGVPQYDTITGVNNGKVTVGYHYPFTFYKSVRMSDIWLELFGFVADPIQIGIWTKEIPDGPPIHVYEDGGIYYYKGHPASVRVIKITCVHELQKWFPGWSGGHELEVTSEQLNMINNRKRAKL